MFMVESELSLVIIQEIEVNLDDFDFLFVEDENFIYFIGIGILDMLF